MQACAGKLSPHPLGAILYLRRAMRSSCLSPVPGGRRRSATSGKGMPSSVSMNCSSRKGCRASLPVSAMILSSLPRFRRQSRDMSLDSSADKPSQACCQPSKVSVKRTTRKRWCACLLAYQKQESLLHKIAVAQDSGARAPHDLHSCLSAPGSALGLAMFHQSQCFPCKAP